MRGTEPNLSPSARGGLLAGIIIAGCVNLGCSPSVRAPEQLPTFNIDTRASEVQVRGPQADTDRAERLRSSIAGALSNMMQRRPGLDAAPPARFTAKIDYEIQSWPAAACLLVLSMFGCPLSTWTFEVDLVLEVDGRIYRGSGRQTAASGIYYNTTGHDGVAGATEKALAAALRSAGASGSQRTHESGEEDSP